MFYKLEWYISNRKLNTKILVFLLFSFFNNKLKMKVKNHSKKKVNNKKHTKKHTKKHNKNRSRNKINQRSGAFTEYKIPTDSSREEIIEAIETFCTVNGLPNISVLMKKLDDSEQTENPFDFRYIVPFPLANTVFTARSILNDTILFFINFRFTMKSRFHSIIFLFSLFQRSIKII